MLKIFTIIGLALLALDVSSYLMYAECNSSDDVAYNDCKFVTHDNLPISLKNAMSGLGCDVKPATPYDYGYNVDLNDDGIKEYAFCCNYAPHGPCNMKIFVKFTDDWKEIGPEKMPGYADGETPCLGFTILDRKTGGFHDICSFDMIFKYNGTRYTVTERVDACGN